MADGGSVLGSRRIELLRAYVETPGRLVYERLLPALPVSVGRIRGELDDVAARLNASGTCRADMAVLVTEAVTNAVLHGRPRITLLVSVDKPSIGVAVADSGEDLPAKPHGPPPPSQPSGRGLMIVDALASAWGVAPNPDELPGKVVWFELNRN